SDETSINVLIVHQLHEGKHRYEVKNVVKHRNSSGGKHIIRRGDTLVQINGTDLQDLPPDQLAQAIAKGQPMLTVHKSGRKKEHFKQLCSMENVLHPISKEATVLEFSMEMVREEVLQQNESGLRGDKEEYGDAENNLCPAEDEEKKRESNLLVVTMTETSFSVLRGRGCDSGSDCRGCHGTGCTLNDIVIVAKSSKVTLVSRGGGTFKQMMALNTAVEHVASHKYLRGLCSQKTLYVSPQPEKMTIYCYKSTYLDQNYPVVLNFSDSDCFLKCAKKEERVLLQVEAVDKKMMKSISMNDETKLCFVFYMKSDSTKQRTFESALYRGWYMQIASSASTDSVEMAKSDGHQGPQSFLFIIQT
uniref:Interleukin-1 beta n=1 Tax=Hippocampus comes TaxID=109280 RepID=A0A3Q2YF55_HIPCM